MGIDMPDRHKVNSLTMVPGTNAVEGKIAWEPRHSLWNGGMMLAALTLGPLYFTWGAFFIALIIGAITLCAGHSVGFHRRLIHRSFQCPKGVERTLVLLGACVGMGGPFWTIRTHDTRDWAQRQPECHKFYAHGYGVLRDLWCNLHCRLHLANPPLFDPGPALPTILFTLC